jgi:hypothetical protein
MRGDGSVKWVEYAREGSLHSRAIEIGRIRCSGFGSGTIRPGKRRVDWAHGCGKEDANVFDAGLFAVLT